jgi:hypothetical protein
MIMRHVSLSFHNLCAGEEYTAASDISAGVSSAGDATAPATTLADISTGDATATSPRARPPAAPAVTARRAALAPPPAAGANA